MPEPTCLTELDLPLWLVLELEAEAERRGVSLDELVAELLTKSVANGEDP